MLFTKMRVDSMVSISKLHPCLLQKTW